MRDSLTFQVMIPEHIHLQDSKKSNDCGWQSLTTLWFLMSPTQGPFSARPSNKPRALPRKEENCSPRRAWICSWILHGSSGIKEGFFLSATDTWIPLGSSKLLEELPSLPPGRPRSLLLLCKQEAYRLFSKCLRAAHQNVIEVASHTHRSPTRVLSYYD